MYYNAVIVNGFTMLENRLMKMLRVFRDFDRLLNRNYTYTGVYRGVQMSHLWYHLY